MDNIKEVFNSDGHAKYYDKRAKDYFSSQVVFGLSFEYVKPGDTLLDMGVGTGITSSLFYKAGLKVYGMDFSSEMLRVCEGKKVNTKLIEHDLRNPPYPFDDGSFDNATCVGVMHMFNDIDVFFKEASRILKPEGIFAFGVLDRNETDDKEMIVESDIPTIKGSFTMYRHSENEISGLLQKYGFSLVNSLKFSEHFGKITYHMKAYTVLLD